MTIGFIGLGLIGGSLAKTIHRVHPEITLVAYDTNPQSLQQAAQEGIIQVPLQELSSSLGDCSYLFLCAPVQENQGFLEELIPLLGADCVLTDTGSVKCSIHSEIQRLGLTSRFIGGHPMAGSEKCGYRNSTAYLLENVYYLITPEADMDPQQVSDYQEFIASLGCIPLLMSPEEHDFATGAVSHLPHILASSLVNLVDELDDSQGTMKTIAAGGFKDITRIASSSPGMWQEICLSNSTKIHELLTKFSLSLDTIRAAIAQEDAKSLMSFFQNAKDYRDSLAITMGGPLPRIYELYCDLIDEAGGIATIATILATNNISIKNIGIIHNREFEDGVLRIEFYQDSALDKALELLQRHHYMVHKR